MYLYLIVSFILIIHYFFDTHYFFRVFVHCFCARYVFKKINFMESSSIYAICMTSDVDLLLTHMNNARFLREFDFGRMEYGFRTRLMDEFIKRGGNFLVSGVTIRYRLSVNIFSPYKVVTTPIHWDEKYLYFDQRIITIRDGIVRALAFTKICTVISIEDYVQEHFPNLKRPDMTPDLEAWIRSQDISRSLTKREPNLHQS